MTITMSDLQREQHIECLKNQIANLGHSRDSTKKQINDKLAELASYLGMDVVGECLVEKQKA